jgi:hypothetical protein
MPEPTVCMLQHATFLSSAPDSTLTMRLTQLLTIEIKRLGKIRFGIGVLLAGLAVLYWPQGQVKTDKPMQKMTLTRIHLPLPGQEAAPTADRHAAKDSAPRNRLAATGRSDTRLDRATNLSDAPDTLAAARSEIVHYAIKASDTLEGIFLHRKDTASWSDILDWLDETATGLDFVAAHNALRNCSG